MITNRLYKQKIDAGTLVDEHLPQIHADSQQLEQVLVNLYLNAIDAMPEGGKLIIGARMEAVDGVDGGIVLTEPDTGFGIEEMDLPKGLSTLLFGEEGQRNGAGPLRI